MKRMRKLTPQDRIHVFGTTAFVLIIAIFDLLSADQVNLAIFYLVPVLYITWQKGQGFGLAAAAGCVMISVLDAATFRSASSLVPYWRLASMLVFFPIAVYAVSLARRVIDDLRKTKADLLEAQKRLMVQTNELEKSNIELERFTAVASHDLKAPLRRIMLFARRIDAHGSGCTAEDREGIRKILRSATRMNHLIDDLLAFSRIGSGTKQLVDLDEVVRDVVEDLEPSMDEGNVVLRDLPTVYADPFQMRQLFQNLVSNALKFRKRNVPPVVEVEGRSVDGSAEIRVRDNGIGFHEKDAPRVFVPFERLHAGSDYEGTGLGMPICKRIVDSHGGHLRVKSRPGEGSEFVVVLPRSPEASGDVVE